jgi:hypothetical protein
VSESCLAEPQPATQFEAVGAPQPLVFDAQGNLPPMRGTH